MTQTEFFGLAGFVLLIIGAISGAWWRVEGKINQAKESAYFKADEAKGVAIVAEAKAALAREELNKYQTHVAETYISKAGHRESNEQIMSALTNVKSAIDGTNQRIDRLFDERPKKQS